MAAAIPSYLDERPNTNVTAGTHEQWKNPHRGGCIHLLSHIDRRVSGSVGCRTVVSSTSGGSEGENAPQLEAAAQRHAQAACMPDHSSRVTNGRLQPRGSEA